MKQEITVKINGNPIKATAGQTLSEIVGGEKPCGGHGRCGKCRLIARGALSPLGAEERKHLSDEEFEDGWRLACLATAEGDCEVTLPQKEGSLQIADDVLLPTLTLAPAFGNFGIAIDIGTTTIAARLYSADGALLARSARLNPQQEWGADVISRIESALKGDGDALADAVRRAISETVSDLASEARIDPALIDGAVITGNTVMLSLLTKECVEPFSHAPFEARRLFGETLSAGALGLSPLKENTEIYLPPCISAFVGADITCAILATRLCEKESAMLADIGTNGEMALWHEGRLSVCSTAAGPAFEGVGISCGMRGAVGAVDKVCMEGDALRVHVIGEAVPKGICGSGLIDAVACMLELEVLDEGGFLEEDPFILSDPVCLTGRDIRMLQNAKSAVSAGVLTLLQSENAEEKDITDLYIAGGFGNYLNKTSAARIGLLPPTLAERAKTVGNAALAGASVLLLDNSARKAAKALAESAETLDLSANKFFSEQYMLGMMF